MVWKGQGCQFTKTGFEEIGNDVPEADFWPALLKVRPGPVSALPLPHLQLYWPGN